ncbi:hypothetical protein ACKP2L_05445 [Oenococcus alcoholitolerans]
MSNTLLEILLGFCVISGTISTIIFAEITRRNGNGSFIQGLKLFFEGY